MDDHIKRITLEIDAATTAEEAREILDAVFAKLASCWADTTTGPIYDDSGKHVANAKVEKLPLQLQLAAGAS